MTPVADEKLGISHQRVISRRLPWIYALLQIGMVRTIERYAGYVLISVGLIKGLTLRAEALPESAAANESDPNEDRASKPLPFHCQSQRGHAVLYTSGPFRFHRPKPRWRYQSRMYRQNDSSCGPARYVHARNQSCPRVDTPHGNPRYREPMYPLPIPFGAIRPQRRSLDLELHKL